MRYTCYSSYTPQRRAKEQTVVRKQIALRLRPVLHTTGRTNIMANDSRCRVLLGLTGSVAVIKAPQLVVELSKFAEVIVKTVVIPS